MSDRDLLIVLGVGVLAYFVWQQQSRQLVASPMLNSYQNAEEWEIVRDTTGRIAGITIHRDAHAV
jgi:hypothetical protein